MQEYKVETGIPIPEAQHGKAGRKKGGLTSFLLRLKVGESFLVDTRQLTSYKGTNTFVTSLHKAAHMNGLKLVTRKVDSNHMRVWRVRKERAANRTNHTGTMGAAQQSLLEDLP